MTALEQVEPEHPARALDFVVRESDVAEHMPYLYPDNGEADLQHGTKIPWACSRGFSEKEWNNTYLLWKAASQVR